MRNDETVLVDIETNLEQSQEWSIGAYSYRYDEFTQIVSLNGEQTLMEDFCSKEAGDTSYPYQHYGALCDLPAAVNRHIQATTSTDPSPPSVGTKTARRATLTAPHRRRGTTLCQFSTGEVNGFAPA